MTVPNLRQTQQHAAERLRAAGCDTPELDAAILLRHLLGYSREQLWLKAEDMLAPAQNAAYEQLIERRCRREPIAYITGEKEFWNSSFRVSPATLIPRPDTETLIECVLQHASKNAPPRHILDLGTGTGCILLSLLQEFPEATGLGVDISPEALAVARDNGDRLGLSARADWLLSDMDTALDPTAVFDLLVSNPPYIPQQDLTRLPPDVALHEPHLALFAEEGGFACYHRLARLGKNRLTPGGACFVEVGDGQAGEIVAIFQQHGWMWLGNRRDLRQTERICGFGLLMDT